MSSSSATFAPSLEHPEADSNRILYPKAPQDTNAYPEFDTFLSYPDSSSPADIEQAIPNQAHQVNPTSDASKDAGESQSLASTIQSKFASSVTRHLATIYPNLSPTYNSPYASTQDSVSTSSKGVKRKLSSGSTKSSSGSSYKTMAEDADMADWKPDELMMGEDGLNFGGFTATPNASNPLQLDQDFERSNTLMENDFDFDSAASSPSPYGPKSASARRRLQSRDLTIPYRGSPKPQPALHSSSVPDRKFSKPSQAGFSATAGNSRETSPTSGLVFSHEPSPSPMFPTQSPSPSGEGKAADPMLGAVGTSPWQASASSFNTGVQPTLSMSGFTPSPGNQLASPFSPSKSISDQSLPYRLLLHPTPLKSRVETQIPIRMSLHPAPVGVTKLHLPTHSISKPKLMVKPEHVKSRDVLELSTMVVCTSAMSEPEKLTRAFARAAGNETTPPLTPVKTDARRRSSSGSAGSKESDSSDANDPNKPLNGGEIKICEGCMQRERKRASRKKVKKPEEEDAWLKDERKRVVVFNTNELKEWGMPTNNNDIEDTPERPIPVLPEGAVQVDAPMRIACYCRHQSEKTGFQVIFTIKDWKDKVLAQAITTSIMITDDHKTSGVMPANILTTGPGMNMAVNPHPEMNSAVFPPPQGFGFHQSHTGPGNDGFSNFRMSHSHSDLQALQQQHPNFAPQFAQPHLPYSGTFQSQNTSATMTPRNLSRHASPTGPSGPSHKKRKSSTHARIPTGLAMTRLETNSPPGGYAMSSAGPSSANPSGAPSPFSSSYTTMVQDNNQHISLQTSMPLHTATGPPTPAAHDYGAFSQANRSHSMENLSRLSLFSAPASTHPSRPSTPSNAQRGAANFQQAQAQAISNRLLHQLPQQNVLPRPTIHKLVPNEGPTTGGVEITCLGSGFYQGLEVMFGDVRATTTTYWGEASLVCLLPPAAAAGVVSVTFTHLYSAQNQQQFGSSSPPPSSITFNYLDGRETEIMKLALTILGQKWTTNGQALTANSVARQIVNISSPPSGQWGRAVGNNIGGGSQSRSMPFPLPSDVEGLEIEARLLKCLDLIDMDENPSQPMWEMRTHGGQTILHLACALGLHHFVAALLARGVNPEPRDHGGFSPMHFAALHDYPKLVHRLLINGADPTMRSLAGFQPANLAKSEEVLAMTRKVMKHSRARRRSAPRDSDQLDFKMTLAQFLEQQAKQRSSPSYSDPGESLTRTSSANKGKVDSKQIDRAFWIRSRKNSVTGEETVEVVPQPKSESATSTVPAPIATFKKLAMQLQNLPHAPFKPSIPDYQKYLQLTTRGLNSLVTWDVARQDFFPMDLLGGNARYTWKELLNPPELPSYHDLYPNGKDGSLPLSESFDDKGQPTLQPADKIECINNPTEHTDVAEPSSSSSSSALPETIDLRRGSKSGLTDQQREQIRAAHLRKIKRIKSDRTLFFFWVYGHILLRSAEHKLTSLKIPSLIFILLMITYNGLTRIWDLPRSISPSFDSLVPFRGV
ncbi:MAG: hypothetical protein M1814_000040 [Vezdaea aestivalis]|nr:MAG: hypothetical protein M1814_000040 [Vezdaea aestivalis]